MKRVFLLMIIGWASLASAAVFTAAANGDWQATATWGSSGSGCHNAYPCMTDTYSGGPTNGDVVNLNGHTVTCGPGETCSVGASNTVTTVSVANCITTGATPAAIIGLLTGSNLTINGTATFIYAGIGCLRFGALTASAGAKIYHDSSWALTPAGYMFADNDGTNTNTTGWCLGDSGCGATAGANPVLWDGDSWASPNSCRLGAAGCNAHCASGNTSGCTAGATLGGSSITGAGLATITNAVIQNVSPNSAMWYWRAKTNTTLKFTNVKFTNDGSITLRPDSATTSAVLDGISCTAAGTGHSLFTIGGQLSPNNITIKNSWIECQLGGPAGGWYPGELTVQNSVLKAPWSAGAGFVAGTHNVGTSGFTASHVALVDQTLFYVDTWGDTGSTENNSANVMTSSLELQNSIIQVSRNQTVGGVHLHASQNPKTDSFLPPVNPAFWWAINNVYSGFGSLSPAATDAAQQGNSSGGVVGGGPTSMVNWTVYKIFGNVMTCGVYGRGPMAGIAGSYVSQNFVSPGNGGSTISITVQPSTPSSGSATFSAGSSIFGSFPNNANFYLYQGGSTENVNNTGPYTITSNTGTTITVSDPGNATVSQTVTAVPAYGWWGTGTHKIFNNTMCTGLGDLATANLNGGGYIGTESAGSAFGAVDANSNLFFRADAPGTGSVPSYGSYETSSGPGHANYTNNPAFGGVPGFNSVIYNAEINGKAADSSVAPCINSSPALSCTYARIKPTTSTDMILVNQAPGLVDPTRNFVDFGLYLDENSLFPGGQNAATFYGSAHTIDLGNDASIPVVGSGVGQHQGATTVTTTAAAKWASGTTYVPGNIVYVDGSITSPVDYSKSLLGRRSYWICKYGHTSSSANAPIIGSDASNTFIGPTAIWEDAWLTLWLKPAILAQNASSSTANTYGTTIFEDGGLPPLGSSPGLTPAATYAVGLVNRFLRQGFVVDDPRLWGFYPGTNQCNTSSGGGAATQSECGGVTKPMIQHIPPPVMAN